MCTSRLHVSRVIFGTGYYPSRKRMMRQTAWLLPWRVFGIGRWFFFRIMTWIRHICTDRTGTGAVMENSKHAMASLEHTHPKRQPFPPRPSGPFFFFWRLKKTRGNDSTRPAQLFFGGGKNQWPAGHEVYVHNDWEDFRFKALKEIWHPWMALQPALLLFGGDDFLNIFKFWWPSFSH